MGLALAAALEDLAAPPYNYAISDATRQLLWRSLEEGMAEGLAEVHSGHRAVISAAPPAPVPAGAGLRKGQLRGGASSSTGGAEAVRGCVEGAGPSTSGDSAAAADAAVLASLPAGLDPSAQFPLYRYVDGRWTILLRDVDVRLKVPGGTHLVASMPPAPPTRGGGAVAKEREPAAGRKRLREEGSAAAEGGSSSGGGAQLSRVGEVVVRCDFLEISADGAASKAQRTVAEAAKVEAMARQTAAVAAATAAPAAAASSRGGAQRSANNGIGRHRTQ